MDDEILCAVKISNSPLGLDLNSGDHFLFVFTAKEKADQFVRDLSIFLPEISFNIVPFDDISDLMLYTLTFQSCIVLNAFFEINVHTSEFDPNLSYMLRIKEAVSIGDLTD